MSLEQFIEFFEDSAILHVSSCDHSAALVVTCCALFPAL
jgi:hypothetical protein